MPDPKASKSEPSLVGGILRIACVASALGTIVFLGAKPTPGIEELNVVPIRWARYMDARDDLRNVLGFLILGLVVLGVVPARGRRFWSRGFVMALLFLLLLVPALESVQHFLPGRRSDARDLLTGWCGVALAVAVIGVLRCFAMRMAAPAEGPPAGQAPSDAA